VTDMPEAPREPLVGTSRAKTAPQVSAASRVGTQQPDFTQADPLAIPRLTVEKRARLDLGITPSLDSVRIASALPKRPIETASRRPHDRLQREVEQESLRKNVTLASRSPLAAYASHRPVTGNRQVPAASS
jgi:hypothetical protein